MGPKKIKNPTNPTKKDEKEENPSKPAAEQPKKQTKQSKEPVSEPKPSQTKKQAKKPEESKAPQSQLIKTDSKSMQKKISLEQNQNLSEAEILQRRKMRFRVVGSEVNGDEAEKVARERMEKFGAVIPESKEDLQRRRQKFATSNPLNAQEDQATIDKRRQKFGGGSAANDTAGEDKNTLQERKKKFGANDVVLDDLIQKGKKEHHQNRHDRKRSKPHHHSGRSHEHYDQRQKRFKR